MKAVILAGGLGTRIIEESHLKPKPMIEIGGKPRQCNYFLHMSDVTFDMAQNRMEVHQNSAEPWRVTLVDTGPDTMTGGRLRRVRDHLDDEAFCFTYGDGVADIDIAAQLAFHRGHGKQATVTAIQPPGRYGALDINAGRVLSFQEKPAGDGAWINGGFFVLEPRVIDYIDGDQTSWEAAPLVQLVALALAYNRRSLFVRLAHPNARSEAITSWPRLMSWCGTGWSTLNKQRSRGPVCTPISRRRGQC